MKTRNTGRMIRINPLDQLFSQVIRTRDNWTCQRCGRYFPEGSRQGLDCSHFFGRANRGTRWDEENACAHCRGCHAYFTANPILFTEWVQSRLGPERYQLLSVRAHGVTKYTAWDLSVLKANLRARLAELEGQKFGAGLA